MGPTIKSLNAFPTKRECEVLELLSRGKCLKEAALELGISHKTTDAHLYNLKRKLGAHNQAQAVRRMIELGYLRVSISPPSLSEDTLARIAQEAVMKALMERAS